MTDKNLTWITGIIDRSGSMKAIRGETQAGWSAYLHEQMGSPGRVWVSLTQFDFAVEVVYDFTPIHAVPAYDLRPRGTTALLDAIGLTVNRLGQRLAEMPEPERPGSVIVAILTDGYENASREFTAEQIKAMVQRQQDAYQWLFVFLAANQDAVFTGQRYGVYDTHAMTFTGANTTEAFAAAGANTRAYRAGTAAGQGYAQTVALSQFSQEQRSDAVD